MEFSTAASEDRHIPTDHRSCDFMETGQNGRCRRIDGRGDEKRMVVHELPFVVEHP